MINPKKALKAAEIFAAYCAEQVDCQNCIFKISGYGNRYCAIGVLVEAKKKHLKSDEMTAREYIRLRQKLKDDSGYIVLSNISDVDKHVSYYERIRDTSKNK